MRKYIEETSTPGENIVGEATFSWLFLFLSMAPFWFCLIVVYLGFEVLTHSSLGIKIPADVIRYAFLGVFVVGIWQYLAIALPWVNTEIAVTNRRVVYSHGFFARRTAEIAINRLEGVNMNQSFTGRIFNFGSLVIFGIGVDEVKLPPIANPIEFRRAIQEAVTSATTPDASFLGSQ